MSYYKWLDQKLSGFGLITLHSYKRKLLVLRKRYKGLILKASDSQYLLGYATAEAEKKHTIDINYRVVNYEPDDVSLVLPTQLPITDSIVERFDSILPEKNGPSPDQKSMIYSNNRCTRVVAGAGSGKSTTLALRVLLLYKYLHIPLSQMTVFSFTNASCADFREKLINTFESHGVEITNADAKALVRTFHSKVLQLARGTIVKPGFNNFEFLGDKKDYDEETYPGGLGTKLLSPQIGLLKECYQLIYSKNEVFRDCIDDLYLSTLHKSRAKFKGADDLDRWRIEKAQQRDFEYTASTNSFFSVNGIQCDLINLPLAGLYDDLTFYANAYIEELDLYVVFAPHKETILARRQLGESWPEYFGEGKNRFDFNGTAYQKGMIIQRFCDKNVQILTTQKDVNIFNEKLERYLDDLKAPRSVAPIFQYQLEGEIESVDIWEAFYQLANFIENVGLEVSALERVNLPSAISSDDKGFLKALCIFWPRFDTHLSERQLIRFHHCFSCFSELQPENYKALSDSLLKSFSHTMIDEFQDISPEIVYWIRGILRYLKQKEQSTSFLVVGDDDQSIYGWRGSDPQFIMDFDNHFPTKNGSYYVSMTDNYRSKQEIVNTAESVLESLHYRDPTKHGKCSRGFGGGVEPIKERDDSVVCQRLSGLWEQYQLFSKEEKSQRKKDGDDFVLVLSRSNKTLDHVEGLLLSELRMKKLPKCAIRFETFHRSKGLEADYCVLLDDCAYYNHYPVKNFIYAATNNFKQTYDEAQRDEAMRLAYVAVTRAKQYCWWYGAPREGGAIQIVFDHLTTIS